MVSAHFAQPVPTALKGSCQVWALILTLLGALALPAAGQTIPVVEKTLGNGMRVLLVERHNDPSIACGWVAHVGSSNERPGITGIAHLFEHMMFKGTPTIGTKNYAKDLEIINAQEEVREQMRQEDKIMRARLRRGEIDDLTKPENQTERYKVLDRRFNDLVRQQREILVGGEFDRIYSAEGASSMNAFTTEDFTAYFVDVPANKLELWMWMESERIARPVFREFYAERDVVFEERRMSTESTPLGKFEEEFDSMFWESCPYGWPVVGWPSDLPAISKAQADDFYSTYYSPQNLTLILVGDFKSTQLEDLARRYFERIPRWPKDPPEVVTREVKQEAEKRMNAEADTNPQVEIQWHTVPFAHRDSYALMVLGQLLSTRTGRLYKGLVLDRGVATETSAAQSSRKWAGLFGAGAEARQGHKPEELEQAIYQQLETIENTPIPAEELQKVKNNIAAGEYRRLASNFGMMMHLIQNDGLGDWREVNAAGPKLQAVTAADVQRVAKTYLTPENRTVALYTRKPGTSPSETPTKAPRPDGTSGPVRGGTAVQ